ncbi:DHA2 family efflux MFS transporter permease subunit [bacterium]|nr:DHA2 family efflux MFS transporter permease subunit [bacterium]
MEKIISKENSNLKKWLLLIPTMLATFMFTLDETIANIALPHIAGSFSVSSQESIWILTSYLIASCLTIPMIDWLTRLIGRKTMFISMVALFTVASFFCGISSSMIMIVIARFLQGLGGGVLMPIAQAIIMEAFKGKELSLATTIFGLVVIIAPIIGPVLGGWITENYSWHWIFFINIPVGVAILIMAQSMIYDPPYAQKQQNVKTDWWGIFFLFCFAVAFEIMMDKGNDLDWFNSPFICRLTVIWVIALIGFIISQIKGKETLVRLEVLKDWNLATGTLALTIINAIMLGSLAILPQFMQIMMRYDSFTSGLSMMPRGFGCLLGLFMANSLQQKVDSRLLSAFGIFVLCLGSWFLGDINLQISQSAIVFPNILYGFGMALGMVPLITLSCKTVKKEDMSNASGLQNFIKTIGGAVGTSLVATFISRFSQTHQNMMTHFLNPTNDMYNIRLQTYSAQFSQFTDAINAHYMAQKLIYNQLLQQARLWAYIDSFRIYAVLGLLIILILFMMKSDVNNKK